MISSSVRKRPRMEATAEDAIMATQVAVAVATESDTLVRAAQAVTAVAAELQASHAVEDIMIADAYSQVARVQTLTAAIAISMRFATSTQLLKTALWMTSSLTTLHQVVLAKPIQDKVPTRKWLVPLASTARLVSPTFQTLVPISTPAPTTTTCRSRATRAATPVARKRSLSSAERL